MKKHKLNRDAIPSTGNEDREPRQSGSFSADVSAEEKAMLEQSENSMATEDDLNQRRAMLDDRDEDGESLNENADNVTGEDLDVPGSEEDDENEEIGEEDEENNSYSLGADKDD